MQKTKFSITFGGQKRTILALTGLFDSDAKKAPDEPQPKHYIQIIDRSWSMSYNLNSLLDSVLASTKLMTTQDKVSILWFSGEGQYGTALSNMNPHDSAIESMLQAMRSPIGLTCYSEVIDDIDRTLTATTLPTEATFFTDGSPVVNWSAQEEAARVKAKLAKLTNLSCVNVVGFGNYYNQDLLKAMIDDFPLSQFTHISQVDQYLDAVTANMGRGQTFVNTPLSVQASNEILVTFEDIAKLYPTSTQSSSTPLKTAVFVIGDNKSEININGEIINAKDVPLTKQSDLHDLPASFLRAYASANYYQGKRKIALDIAAKNIKDLNLAEKIIGAFTKDEVQEAQTLLDQSLVDENVRFATGVCPPNFVPKKDATCVMDVLQTLGVGGCKYVPFSSNVQGYERTTRKTSDDQSTFTPSKDEVLAPIKFVYNKDRLNVSLQIEIPGTVQLNKKAAKRVDLDEVFATSSYKNHTFVKDGNLNVPQAEFEVTDEIKVKLKEMKVKFDEVGPNRVVINFNRIPMINEMFNQHGSDVKKVAAIRVESLELETESKAIKHFIAEIEKTKPSSQKVGAYKTFKVDQIAVLQDHGINKSGNYTGVNRQTDKGEMDFYETKSLDLQVKSFSSIPSINAVLKKQNSGAKMTVSEAMLFTYVNQWQGADLPTLTARLDEAQTKLRSNTTTLHAIKMSKVLIGDWFTGLEKDAKDNEFVTTASGHTVMFKATHKRQYIS